MGFLVSFLLALGVFSSGQHAHKTDAPEAKAVTVPATIDHNRVLIEVEVPLPGGATQKVRAWIDNDNPQREMSRRLATAMGLNVSCNDQECSAPAPETIFIGGMAILFADAKDVKIPLKPVSAAAVLEPGLNAEMNLPSTVLRSYDVLIDFVDQKFTIGPPGSIHFQGSSGKVDIAENGLILVPSRIENKKCNLALDLGSSISFLSTELFNQLASAHPQWPHMTGAVGPANVWGADAETKWSVMRLDRLQFGPLFLIDVPIVPGGDDTQSSSGKGVPTLGSLGADLLQNYRVGLDYAHSSVYFDIGRLTTFPDFDVVGLTLRPEDDGNYTILSVPEIDGKPAVPSGADGVQPGDHLIAVNQIPVHGATMGQVWSLLGGTPGQERKLTIERDGKQLTFTAQVQHFLAAEPSEDRHEKKSKR
jgi:hypothetical protein